MKEYELDKKRYSGGPGFFVKYWLLLFRLIQRTNNKFLKFILRILFFLMSRFKGLEISPRCCIAPGLYLGHVWGITVNTKTIIGKNLNIHKGVTIGQENRGKRKGTPIIGNDVWMGVNCTVVGKISIGDDVMIVPNTYVNCDIPSHSIVIGCPCKIISRMNATEGYINNKI